MNQLYTYLDITFPNTINLWKFLFTNKYERVAKKRLIKNYGFSTSEIISCGKTIISIRVGELVESIPYRFMCLRIRAAKLNSIDVQSIHFIHEFTDIDFSLRQYRRLEAKVGLRRATNYMLANRVQFLLNEHNMHQHLIGHVINIHNGRDDFKFIQKYQKIIEIINEEFDSEIHKKN